MSGETLVVGSLIFKEKTADKTKLQVLEELAGAIEVEVSDLRYDIHSRNWAFQSINWQSHIEREGIEDFLNRNKGALKELNCSLYHLTEPEEINYREENKKNKQQEE